MVIRTEADLVALMRPESLRHPFRKPPILLAFPEMRTDETAVWAYRLENLRLECGCRAAAIGLGVFTLASLAYVLVAALQTSAAIEPDYPRILFNGSLLVVGLVLSALFGKFIGLALAARRFDRTCRELLNRLAILKGATHGGPSDLLRRAGAVGAR